MLGRVVAFACLAVGMLGFCASGALAETVVSGDRDSNAPLVIDPSSDPDDSLTTDITAPVTTVLVVQAMPVTKRVNQVTLGDVARLSSCGSGQSYLQIHEHAEGSLVGSPSVRYYSTGAVPVPTTPSKLTWSFTPFTMRKGYTYTFVLERSGCATFKQTTWVHNEPQVNGGPERCTSGPQGWRRMWHELNADDAVAGCVDYASGSRTFDPSMHSGWLVSQIAQNGSSLWDVRMTSQGPNDPPPVCLTPNPPNTYDAYGGAAAYWRAHPGNPFMTDFSCEWSQYAPLDSDLDHGWYYAQPWMTERSGAPRDMYLKLDTIDYDALLEDHSPVLLYDSEEDFFALSPGAVTDFYDDADDPDDPGDTNRMDDGEGSFAASNPTIAMGEGIDELGLGFLDGHYEGVGRRDGTAADADDFLSERGNGQDPLGGFDPGGYAADAATMEAREGYANLTYGRVAHAANGDLWLQYWIYYYYDPQANGLGSGMHEGDWEMVQIRLNGSYAPDRAAYAQHGSGETCPWSSVDSVDGHPAVYVARGSHASYFREGPYEEPSPDDSADGLGAIASPLLVQVWANTPWIAWPGTWGDSGASPDGPAFQGPKWDAPESWITGLHQCDMT